MNAIQNPGYFLEASSWETALSTGSLAHMSTEEAGAYAGAAQAIRVYTGLQGQAVQAEMAAQSFVAGHPARTPEQVGELIERLSVLSREEAMLAYVAPQMNAQIDQALRAAAGR